MKRIITFFSCILLIGLISCGNNDTLSSEKNIPEVEYSYVEEITSMDDMISYSTNIIKATLLSVDEFDGYVKVYLFDVEEDYTQNTPDEIHMYDAYNEQYIVGHSYYLFLCSGENALYPHSIYTTVKKELVLDTSKTFGKVAMEGGYNLHPIAMTENTIHTALQKDLVGKNVPEASANVIESTNISDVSAQADVVAEVKVSHEQPANKYASTYAISVVSQLKGPENAIPTALILPPNLDANVSYYVYLEEDPTCPGAYVLLSRGLPVSLVNEETTRQLVLEEES